MDNTAELSLLTAPSDMVFCRHPVFAPATVSTGILMIRWISEIHSMLTKDLTLKCAMQSLTLDCHSWLWAEGKIPSN